MLQSPSGNEIKPNILMAIPYCKRDSLELVRGEGDRVNFLLDSGAFTAWKTGKEITIDTYCNFVNALPFTPFGYFTLDKIGDPEGTEENYRMIRERGLNPIPVFTRGSDWSLLEEMFRQVPLVGIGGLVGTNSNKLFVRDVLRRAGGRALHLLGFTNKDFIAQWKPFSVDFSTANTSIAHGQFMIYEGNGKLRAISRQNFRDETAEMIRIASPFVEWCEEDLFDLRNDSGWKKGSTAQNISSKACAAYAIEAERLFGTKVFIAVDNVLQLENNLRGWDFCAERMAQ